MKRAAHLLDDAWLAPYADAVRGRGERSFARADSLAASAGSLSAFANAHEYYGLHRVRGGWIFREWAPNATGIWLVGDFSKWRVDSRFALRRIPGRDVWEGRFPAGAISHGQFYRLEMRWNGGRGERIPAYARRVVQDPDTKLFAAQVWSPRPYRWRNQSPVPPSVPLVYEAHVGMAQEEEKVGSYAEFRDLTLPRIAAAGYNVVQLMAVMEHAYYGSFGYHVSSFFAASSRFGTPEELKSLVDAAHGMGLMVIMDIVHSHAVKNERDGLSLFDGTAYQYFHDGPRGWHSAWDSRCFDYGKTDVLHFLLSNCRYWLDEFHFDGFRFDGVTSMLYRHHGLGVDFVDYAQYFGDDVDEDAWTYLQMANRLIHEVRPGAITIAEDVSGMPGCAAPVDDFGMGFDLRLAMGVPECWFKLARDVRDEDWSVGHIWHEITNHRAEERTVGYVESHDQALVGGKSFFFQLVDAAIYRAMRRDQQDISVARGVAIHKMARLATLAAASPAYLNFMGNEFGHPEWIDFPREENGWSYSHARRLWSLRDDPDLFFKCLGDFDRAMVATVPGENAAHDPVLLEADETSKTLAFMRGNLVFIFNFHPSASWTDHPVMVPPGRFRLLMDTDEPCFGGQGRIAPGQVFSSQPEIRGNELIDYIRVYLPCRTAMVLAKATVKRKAAKKR